MAMEQLVFTLLILTGLVAGQTTITTEPTQATGLIGETASFTCGIDFDPSARVMQWEFINVPLYYFNDGNENYPPGMQDKYSVEQDGTTFTLIVQDLAFDDRGAYWCRPFGGAAAGAQLIVLGVPNPFPSITNPTEGTEVMFTCQADFGAGSRSDIADDHYPTMQMIYNGNIVGGEVTEIPPDGPIIFYRFTQNFSRTVEWTDDGQEVTCEIRSANPEVHSIGRLTVNVWYPVQTPTYSPQPEDGKYDVGNIVNCTANGNPTPSYRWQRTGEESPIYGQFLHITEEMVGLINIWTCTASNTVDGTAYEESANVEFSVDADSGPGESGPGDDSWKIAVGVAVPICVIIIGAIVGLVVYTFVIKKKKTQQPRPPSNVPMNNRGVGNQGYKDSREEEDGYYPDEKVPAFTIHTPNRYQNAPNLPFNGNATPPANFAYQTNLLGTGLGSNMSLPLDDRTPEQVYTKPTPTQRTKSQEALDKPRDAHVSFDQSVREESDNDDSDDSDDRGPTPPPPFPQYNADHYRPAALPATIPAPDTQV